MASDNAFAVALLSLWHRVVQAGGSVGFVTPVDRAAIGAVVSEVIAALRAGRAYGFALTRKRDVVGFALITPGAGFCSHTGDIGLLMIDPPSQGAGLGGRLVRACVEAAAASRLDRVRVGVPEDERLERFLSRFGFVETGRSPGWIRGSDGAVRDEVLMTAQI